MGVLLMRLQGPMQSYGTHSNFKIRDTGLDPSKSAVIGMICSAMGIFKDKPTGDLPLVDELAQLKMAVRINDPGVVRTDYHTVQNILKVGKPGTKTAVTERQYLYDADFLVALEGDYQLLSKIQEALKNPVWFVSLGRKSCVPATPIWLPDGLKKEDNCLETLGYYPWFKMSKQKKIPESLIVVFEDSDGETRKDVPISFEKRIFGLRHVQHRNIKLKPSMIRNDLCLSLN